MLKVTSLDNDTAYINPNFVISVTSVREQGGVTLMGTCALHVFGMPVVVTRAGVEEMAKKVEEAQAGGRVPGLKLL